MASTDFLSFPGKHPEAELDYIFDWAPLKNNRGLSNWLREDEVLISRVVDVTEGIVKISDEFVDDDTAVLVWLGDGTVGEVYKIECSIVTNQARKDTRTALVLIKLR